MWNCISSLDGGLILIWRLKRNKTTSHLTVVVLYMYCVCFFGKKRKILFQLFPLNVHYYIYFNHLARWFINKNIVSRYMIYIIIFFYYFVCLLCSVWKIFVVSVFFLNFCFSFFDFSKHSLEFLHDVGLKLNLF